MGILSQIMTPKTDSDLPTKQRLRGCFALLYRQLQRNALLEDTS